MKKELLTEAFQAMLQSTKDMVFVKDADLVYVAASMSFVRMVGKTSVEEIVGHTDMEIFDAKSVYMEKQQDIVDTDMGSALFEAVPFV